MRGGRLYLRALHALAPCHETRLMVGLMLIIRALLVVAMMRLRDCRICRTRYPALHFRDYA